MTPASFNQLRALLSGSLRSIHCFLVATNSPRFAIDDLRRKWGFMVAAAFCIVAMCGATRAQMPILYYAFENNTTRTTFENLVEQAVNSGSGAITRAGGSTTVSLVAGAGSFNGGAAAGQAATGTSWDSSTSDPGSAATNYYKFVVNTTGFSQHSIK